VFLFEFPPLYNDPTLFLMGIFGFEILSSALPSFLCCFFKPSSWLLLTVKYAQVETPLLVMHMQVGYGGGFNFGK
jgi:hypothetical protein